MTEDTVSRVFNIRSVSTFGSSHSHFLSLRFALRSPSADNHAIAPSAGNGRAAILCLHYERVCTCVYECAHAVFSVCVHARRRNMRASGIKWQPGGHLLGCQSGAKVQSVYWICQS